MRNFLLSGVAILLAVNLTGCGRESDSKDAFEGFANTIQDKDSGYNDVLKYATPEIVHSFMRIAIITNQAPSCEKLTTFRSLSGQDEELRKECFKATHASTTENMKKRFEGFKIVKAEEIDEGFFKLTYRVGSKDRLAQVNNIDGEWKVSRLR